MNDARPIASTPTSWSRRAARRPWKDETAPTWSFGEALPNPPLRGVSSGSPIPFDRSRVKITGLPTETLAATVGTTVIFPALPITPAFSDPEVNHREFELYDPNAKYIEGNATFSTSPNATTAPYVMDGSRFHAGQVVQGRYLLRLVGLKGPDRFVYADASFYNWSTPPLTTQSLPALSAVQAAAATNSLGRVGAAYARSMMLQHQAAVDATGTGTVQGNQCSTPDGAVTAHFMGHRVEPTPGEPAPPPSFGVERLESVSVRRTPATGHPSAIGGWSRCRPGEVIRRTGSSG